MRFCHPGGQGWYENVWLFPDVDPDNVLGTNFVIGIGASLGNGSRLRGAIRFLRRSVLRVSERHEEQDSGE